MRDTSPEAARVQADVYRRLGAQRRLEIAFEMSDAVRRIALARIRRRHPELDEAGVIDQFVWEFHGIRIPRPHGADCSRG